MSVLRLSQSAYNVIRDHANETYPHECCGVLLGKIKDGSWNVAAAVRTSNIRTDSAHSRYQIAPGELVKIQREAIRHGLDIAGFYHSHPDHPAQWSGTDFAEAHWIGCTYVITEVLQGKAAVTNAFLLAGSAEEDKRFDRMTIEVYESRESAAKDISESSPVPSSAPDLVP